MTSCYHFQKSRSGLLRLFVFAAVWLTASPGLEAKEWWQEQLGINYLDTKHPPQYTFIFSYLEGDGTPIREIDLEAASWGGAMAVSPDSRLLAVSQRLRSGKSGDKDWVSVWDTSSGQEYARVDFQGMRGAAVQRITFSPDSERLATSHGDTTVLVWQLDQFRLTRSEAGPERE